MYESCTVHVHVVSMFPPLGHFQARLVYYVMNVHVQPRCIYLCRVGSCVTCTLNNGAIQGRVAIVAAWRKSLQSVWQDWRGLPTLSERRRGMFAGCLILQYYDGTYRVILRIVKARCHPVAIAQVVEH